MAPIGRFGNSGVGVVEGPGAFNPSLGASKAFIIYERLRGRINASFTNVINHSNLSDPILNLTNANFGKVTTEIKPEYGGSRVGQVGARFEV